MARFFQRSERSRRGNQVGANPRVIEGRVLDTYYVATRYANGHVEGPPYEHYGWLQSEEAIEHARAEVPFERRALSFDLLSLPVPAEIVVYTAAECERLLAEGPGFVRRIAGEAVWIVGGV